MKLGAVAYPLNTRLSEREEAAEIERARPALVLTSRVDLTSTEADMPLLGEHDLDAVHCRLLTSGTTGPPRPIDLTYGNFLWSAVGSAFNLGVDPADRWLCCLPLHHVAGLSILMRSVIYGTGTVVHPGFDPDAVGRSLAEDARDPRLAGDDAAGRGCSRRTSTCRARGRSSWAAGRSRST